jgi:hypothetical protein
MLAVLVFFSSIFAVAPMAFCAMKTDMPSCCRKSSAHPCDQKKASCPICSYSNYDRTPITKTDAAPIFQHVLFLSAIPASNLSLPASYSNVSHCYFDSSPPPFALNCVFRI